MRLIQFLSASNERRVGIVEASKVFELNGTPTMRDLALRAIDAGQSLIECASAARTLIAHSYEQLLTELRVLTPLDHDDPGHCLVSGTGLTHWGSADARDRMHAKLENTGNEAPMSDSLRMFRWGVDGGKPALGLLGVQPEWFYKGDGDIVVAPGQALQRPWFAQDAGEEPEVVGLYVIGKDGVPYRLGFALGNDFSDHVTERQNYLYLAHSKLRVCSVGPELLTGPLPDQLEGMSRVVRDNKTLWERPFTSGETHMCHSVRNLEHHHFKYPAFRRPGDVHLHFLGAGTLSFVDGVETRDGDRFEIHMEAFGAPLINTVQSERQTPAQVAVEIL